MASKSFDKTREALLEEIRDILSSAEQLFDEKASGSADDLKKLKSSLNSRVAQAKEKFGELQMETVEGAKEVAKRTDALVHDNPYKAVGVAGLVGLLLGVLIAKK